MNVTVYCTIVDDVLVLVLVLKRVLVPCKFRREVGPTLIIVICDGETPVIQPATDTWNAWA